MMYVQTAIAGSETKLINYQGLNITQITFETDGGATGNFTQSGSIWKHTFANEQSSMAWFRVKVKIYVGGEYYTRNLAVYHSASDVPTVSITSNLNVLGGVVKLSVTENVSQIFDRLIQCFDGNNNLVGETENKGNLLFTTMPQGVMEEPTQVTIVYTVLSYLPLVITGASFHISQGEPNAEIQGYPINNKETSVDYNHNGTSNIYFNLYGQEEKSGSVTGTGQDSYSLGMLSAGDYVLNVVENQFISYYAKTIRFSVSSSVGESIAKPQYRLFFKSIFNLNADAIMGSQTVVLGLNLKEDTQAKATSTFTIKEIPNAVEVGDFVGLWDEFDSVIRYKGLITDLDYTSNIVTCQQFETLFDIYCGQTPSVQEHIEGVLACAYLMMNFFGIESGSKYDDIFRQFIEPVLDTQTPVSNYTLPNFERDDITLWERNLDFFNSYNVRAYATIKVQQYVSGGIAMHFVNTATYTKGTLSNNVHSLRNFSIKKNVVQTNCIEIRDSVTKERPSGVAQYANIFVIKNDNTIASMYSGTDIPHRLKNKIVYVSPTQYNLSDVNVLHNLAYQNMNVEMYNHEVEVDLDLDNNLFDFWNDFHLGQKFDIYIDDKKYDSMLTGYTIKNNNEGKITSVHLIFGKARLNINAVIKKIEANTTKAQAESGGGGGSSSVSWGAITGTLANQNDLQNALNLKADDTDLGYLGNAIANDNWQQLMQEKTWTNSQVDTASYFKFNILIYNGSSYVGAALYADITSIGNYAYRFQCNYNGTEIRFKHNGYVRDLHYAYIPYKNMQNHIFYTKLTVNGYNPQVANGISLDNIQLFDLTAIFGAGNEPSAEMFETLFGDTYYPFNLKKDFILADEWWEQNESKTYDISRFYGLGYEYEIVIGSNNPSVWRYCGILFWSNQTLSNSVLFADVSGGLTVTLSGTSLVVKNANTSNACKLRVHLRRI